MDEDNARKIREDEEPNEGIVMNISRKEVKYAVRG